MAQGSKRSYTSKQKRQASHIEDSEKKSGKSDKRAKQIAYATVNKQDGGGKKSGSGRGKSKSKGKGQGKAKVTASSRNSRRAAGKQRGGRKS